MDDDVRLLIDGHALGIAERLCLRIEQLERLFCLFALDLPFPIVPQGDVISGDAGRRGRPLGRVLARGDGLFCRCPGQRFRGEILVLILRRLGPVSGLGC